MNMHKYKLLLSSNKMVDCVKTGEELLAFFFRSVYSKLSLKGGELWVWPTMRVWLGDGRGGWGYK